MGLSKITTVPAASSQISSKVPAVSQRLTRGLGNGRQVRTFRWTSEAFIYRLRKQKRVGERIGWHYLEELEKERPEKPTPDIWYTRFGNVMGSRDFHEHFGRRNKWIRSVDSWLSVKPDNENAAERSQEGRQGRERSSNEKQHWKSDLGDIDPITNRRVVKNPSIRPESIPRNGETVSSNTFKGYRSQFSSFAPPEDPKNSASQTTDAVEEGLKDYDAKIDYATQKPYDPSQTNIDYSDPNQEGLKKFDEKVAGKPLDSVPNDYSKTLENDCNNMKGGKSGHESREMRVDSIEEAIRDYESQDQHPEIPQELRDHVSDTARRITLSREAFEKQSNRNSFQEAVMEYEHPPPGNSELKASDEVEEGLKAYDCKANYGPKHIIETPVKVKEYLPARHRKDDFISRNEEGTESLDNLRASDIRANVGKSKSGFSEQVEELQIETSELRNHVAHARGRIDAKLAEIEENLPKAQGTKKMTGNFVRDFPEEFETSWSQSESTAGGLVPKRKSELDTEAAVQRKEQAYIDGLPSGQVFSRDPSVPRIETSLDRAVASKEVSSPVKSFPESEVSQDDGRKLVRTVREIYEDQYGTIDCKHRQVPEAAISAPEDVNPVPAEPISAPEPTLYKILVYDPTMQSISTAETTSIVSDSSAPLTPAEVLLRLSNPAKFFPHFEPLQAQGFEIVSGSGDVLVFRRVRSGPPPGMAREKVESSTLRNPIDGMSCPPPNPTTGNFASPAGFVNHDIFPDPRDSEKFVSNIDVRREEHVFSGKKNWEDGREEKKTKSSAGKRILLGTAWLAAASYAVGVVADFFKTGGMDGKGPQGLNPSSRS